MLVYLLKFPLLPIVFLIHSLGIPICVLHVGIYLDMGVGFMESVGDILRHVEVKASMIIIVPVYFNSKVQATGTINIHGLIFQNGFYEVICMFFSNLFYSKIINNQCKCDRSPFLLPKAFRVSALLILVVF